MLLHVGTYHLATDPQIVSFWQRLTPRTRVLCVLLLVFAIALTPNGRWWTWAIYGSALISTILISRVALLALLQRVAVEFVFIGVVLLGTLFHDGPTVLWQWGWLRVTAEGLVILGSVSLKAFLSLLAVNLLIFTTPIPVLLHALVELRTPPLLVAILGSMYRYVSVLIDEFTAMQRAARSRNLMGNQKRQRTIVGNMIGSLFIRTYERGERVHQAMLARGYQGLPPVADVPQASKRDVIALTFTLILALFGQILYLASI